MDKEREEAGAQGGTLHRFANVELDERTRELRVDGRTVNVEAKALAVLLCLLRRPDETLTKDELFEAAWPGRIVTEGTLAKAVMKLRVALGDDAQSVIRTVHGFGYRMGVPVQRLASDAPERFVPAPGLPVPLRRNWRLVEALDAMGRGRVWLAEHVKTRDRRVFKFAADAEGLVALKREITLYRLLHDTLGEAAPVVYLFDWNLEEPPYFIESEWVPDGDLGAWLEASGDEAPDLAVRIEAIAQTAEAVAATHAVGVVHRDLKPANVFVRKHADGGLKVRLADFGISALSDSAAIEALGITRLGFTRTRGGDTSSGTPLYLAPEVIAGQAPTQRSDLYALGVMLYQAVVADPRRPLAPGWEREVEDELLREDIAAVADIDPERRLGDAAELARRLRRLGQRRIEREHERQRQEQVERQRRELERAQLRGRWRAVAAGLLAVGLVVTGGLYLRAQDALELARSEAERADRQAAQAEAVSSFLTEDLLALVDPGESGENEVSVRRAIEFARGNIGKRFAGQPDVEAAVRLRIGMSLRELGEYAESGRELQQALQLSEDPSTRSTIFRALAQAASGDDRIDDALEYATSALAEAGDDPRGRVASEATLAWQTYESGRYEEARERYESVLAEIEGDAALASDRLANDVRAALGHIYSQLGRNDLAEPMLRAQHESNQRRLGPNHPGSLMTQRHLGRVLSRMERHEEAIELLQQEHDQHLVLFGPDHGQYQISLNELATALQNDKRHEQALPLFERLVEARLRLLGERHSSTRTAMNNYGLVLGLVERHDQALVWYRRAYEAEVAEIGESHPDTLVLAHNLARALRRADRIDEAEAMQRRNLEIARELLPADNWQLAVYMAALAETLELRGRIEQALELAEPAAAMIEASFGAEHARSTHARGIVERLNGKR